MPSLEVQAFLRLLEFDFYLARRRFLGVYDAIRQCNTSSPPGSADVVQRVCRAVDIACVWYWKQVLCLQRSAATVCLLKRYGVAATLVIGVQPLPFKAHAWVEVEGRVVNDKSYLPDIYLVLDRC